MFWNRSSAYVPYQRQAIQKVLDKLSPDAPVRAVVASQAVQSVLSTYETADKKAGEAQAAFNSWGQRGILATTCGVLIGALFLFPLDAHLNGTAGLVAHKLQTAALFVTIFAGVMNFIGKPRHHWMESRATAESSRGSIFAAIVASPGPEGADSSQMATQKLKLIDEAYISDQQKFFDRRGEEHKARARWWSPLRLVAYFIVGIAALIGLNLPDLLPRLAIQVPQNLSPVLAILDLPEAGRWQLGLTTIAASFLAHATARTLMDEDARKAALYENTEKKLARHIARQRPAVLQAAATGDQHLLVSYFGEAQTILAQEHAVWSFVRPDDSDGSA